MCGRGRFTCNNDDCIDDTQRCDHVNNCPDGDDELGCGKLEPKLELNDVYSLYDCISDYACRSPHMKQCRDGHCVAVYFFCDGENDCGDWSDEFDCTRIVSYFYYKLIYEIYSHWRFCIYR